MLKLLPVIAVVLALGFITFWATVGLTLVGWPVNPYLTWELLWGGCGLLVVWKLKRNEVQGGKG